MFVLQALSVCVTKLWSLGKSQRWYQGVWFVLAFDKPTITFATIWSQGTFFVAFNTHYIKSVSINGILMLNACDNDSDTNNHITY